MKKFLTLLLSGLLMTTTACGDLPENQANTGNPDTISFAAASITGDKKVNTDTTIGEVITAPEFEDFGRLLFPVDRIVTDDMTLAEVSTSRVYTWYNYIQPEKTVEIINTLAENAESGQQIFYPIYSEKEMTADSSKRDTGLFFFKGEPGAKFAVTNAGGGFAYVGAMHDSFPHALELSKMGYNAFALIYRPDDPYNDLAKAIEFIYDNADELEVDTDYYSLWGGSAGARMAAELGNADTLKALTSSSNIQQAGAVIMQYTGYNSVSTADAPTYACVGTSDGIANYRTMQSRLETLESYGIPTEFHAYDGLPHGFGIGTETIAEGWIYDAVRFWEEQMPDGNIPEYRRIVNLQDYLVARTTNAHGNDYDLNNDNVWNVFDLCLMKRRYLAQNNKVPGEIKEIPQNYYTAADEQGKLEELNYDTYESMTYNEKSQILNKRAIVYLPYGYSDDKQYDVFYLMHGGWSNETTTLGTPNSPSGFKNVIDNAIQNGEIKPIIIVCPTYNNTSGNDSADFSLALSLNRNYHNELTNDLIPAVESRYSTYAKNSTPEELMKSREHRGFGGFSMGSVATWRTFQNCLDYFKYFMPMSCGTSLDDDNIWAAAKNYSQNDYFVFMMVGTEDFSYSYDNNRAEKMRNSDYFTELTKNTNGNFAYRIMEGYSHGGAAANTYTYNGLIWFWN
ncbi:MAG: alpha/beta hydrolase-fold protein [Clostridium sp.]|nr:alpha/beta hydrolase-fold protein [Clostridium sp.]